MRELGVKHYRFSIAWARLFPAGDGPANAAGFAFYNRLIDAMLASSRERRTVEAAKAE